MYSASPPAQAALQAPIGQQPIIHLDAGWEAIHSGGLAKLQQIIASGNLHEHSNGTAATATSSSSTKPAIGFTNEEYARLYTIIYQMCIQKVPHCYSPQLYERYDQSISEYLNTVALPAISRQSGTFLIRELVRRWSDHQIMRKWMCDFFRYLDRFYVKRHSKKPLNEVAILRFRTLVFDKCKTRVTPALLETIRRDRQGEEIDRSMLAACIQIYVDMGLHSLRVYQLEFERAFLDASKEYYARESSAWIVSDSCPEYLRKCEKRFHQEKKRIRDYLVPNTELALLNTLNETLLLHHQRELLEKEHTGVRALLKSHAEDDLTRMYSLYANIPSSLPFIASMLQQHIVDIGASLDKSSATASAAEPGSSVAPASKNTYIEDLMKIHETYFELVRKCFAGHTAFQKALKEAFETLINRSRGPEQGTAAELLATYADDVLRKGGLQLEEARVDATLDAIVRLFSYLVDKDLFAEFYRKQLATRLLTQRSASSDAEKSMIGKLKLLMGAQFTSKLEGMFNDMRNAAEHSAEFQKFLQERGQAAGIQGIEFSVQTLTTGWWPSYPMDELKLPPVMQACIDAFRVYYDSRTNNRKLRWIHDLGVVTLGAHFKPRRLDLVVSSVQAAVLLQFNDVTSLTIDQLISYTGLTPEVMKQTLKSLVSGKFKILLKTPAEGYSTTHTMRVNDSFTSPSIRVRIPNATRKTTPKDRETASSAVSEDRKHAMEANIVRIMKARKTLSHMQLMTEVSQQLMNFFQPDPRAIKQRIEDLIQREYMKRDDEQSNVYHYLA